MQLRRWLATALAAAVAAEHWRSVEITSTGWRRCSPNTIPFDPSDADDDDDLARRERGAALPAECNTFTVPLCYPGVCDATMTLPVFVKRIASPTATRAVWVMDGGPGCSSVDMELFMQDTFMDLNGSFSVYTMDHRGSGRSDMLSCKGDLNDERDAAACVNHLHSKYGPFAEGFSTTSAAMDLVTLSPHINPDADWFVYGVSYGSYLMARTMHLADQFTFKGYLLDSIVPETLNVPNGDAAYGAIAARYLSALDEYLESDVPLHDQLVSWYDELDHDEPTACALWLSAVAGRDAGDPPSFAARRLFSALLEQSSLRTAFLPLFTLLHGCSDADVEVLETYVEPYLVDNDLLEPNFTSAYDSLVLYYVILSSEHQLFYTPAPPLEELRGYFADQVVGNPVYRDFMAYCLFTNNRDRACQAEGYLSTRGFYYTPDKYFNRTAEVPTSLLVLNGGLDPITPDDQAKYQYDQYNTSYKLYANVRDASHAVVDSPCGYEIFLSFLAHDGDVTKVNSTCLDHLPPLELDLLPSLRQDMFGHQLVDVADTSLRAALGLSDGAQLTGITALAIGLQAFLILR
ncbi:serine protease family S33 [Achlya hypogyna]|uniref:Secreted protein n=1 Tax=Achlya hypogyna TaxID=1202772 RepID=A0A0A7CMY1_ACHHY|nr:secreted protein [Achlya hypogyna]OQR86715.1 serine protease family S33 [Achlya hypogyna]